MNRKASSGNRFNFLSLGLGIFPLIVVGRVDGNLDSNGPSTNLLAFECCDGLLLLFLAADVNKTVTLALPGLSPPSANDAGGINYDASISEQSGEASVIDVESEVGYKEHRLGRLAYRVFTSRAGSTRGPGLADTLWFLSSRTVGSVFGLACRGSCSDIRSLAFSPCFGLTLK